MELSENYRIIYDSLNVTLQFHEERLIKAPKTGKIRRGEITEDTYHHTLKDALTAFLHKSIRGSENIEECVQRIEEAERKIEELMKKEELNTKQ